MKAANIDKNGETMLAINYLIISDPGIAAPMVKFLDRCLNLHSYGTSCPSTRSRADTMRSSSPFSGLIVMISLVVGSLWYFRSTRVTNAHERNKFNGERNHTMN